MKDLPPNQNNLLIDIDGTICEDIPNEESHRFPAAQVYDGAVEFVNELYDSGHRITFFTSRKEDHQETTLQWLTKHQFKFHDLLMGKPRFGNYIWVDNLDVRGIKFNDCYKEVIKKFVHLTKQYTEKTMNWFDRDHLNMISRATALAIKGHEGQVRKYTGLPYVTHVLRVGMAVAVRPYQAATAEQIAAAILHDTLEDTEITPKEIQETTNELVLSYVVELTNVSKKLTHPNGKKLNRQERKQADFERLAKISAEAKIIKMYDRRDNLLDMALAPADFKKLYLKESLSLIEVVQDAQPFLAIELNSLIRQMMTGVQ